MGVCSLAKDNEVLMWNRAMQALTGISAESVVGSRLDNIEAPWKNCQKCPFLPGMSNQGNNMSAGLDLGHQSK